MSSPGYETSTLQSSVVRNLARRPSRRPLPYDVPSGPSPRHRTPSPIPSRRNLSYDSYVPPRAGPSHRDEYPNVYRPNNWRPPSPDRYDDFNGPSWSDKRSIPPSPSRETLRRDTMATPMFEPSDVWKQTHVNRPGRTEVSPPVDRHVERRMRRSRERSPDRPPVRNHYSPPRIPGGDRYRPASVGYRDPYPIFRADCYRPQYVDDRRTTRVREPGSSPETPRRDSNSGTLIARSPSNYHDSAVRRQTSRERSTSRSISPWSRARSPNLQSWRGVSNRETSGKPPSVSDHLTRNLHVKAETHGSQDFDEPLMKTSGSRSSSRSSIASSRASDRDSNLSKPQPSDLAVSALTSASANLTPVDYSERKLISSPPCPQFQGRNISSAAGVPPNQPGQTDFARKQFPSDSELVMKWQSCLSKQYPNTIPPTSVSSLDSAAPKQAPSPDHQKLHESQVASPIHPPKSMDRFGNDSAEGADNRLNKLSNAHTSSTVNESPSADGLSPVLTVQPDTKSLLSTPPPTPFLHVESRKDLVGTDVPAAVNDLSAKSTTPFKASSIVGGGIVPSLNSQDSLAPTSRNDVVIDFTRDDIPKMSDAKSLQDALRVVVMTRLLCDRQTREERVEPILMANLSLHTPRSASPVGEQEVKGIQAQAGMDSFRPSLAARFAERQATLETKTQRLREEYLALHERWLAHCVNLDGIAKVGVTEEAAPNPGRTTRRSAATLGDAVRSDLEMEQIIASLGNDDLTDPNHLSARNVAVIPDMISVVCGCVDHVFDDTNNRVNNPSEFYGPETGINDWTKEEKEIFLDKFAAYPKQFGIIADFLPDKCAAQCVDYYYLHKKELIDFRKVVTQLAPNKRRRGTRRDKQKGNGLLADIRQHDDEMHRESASSGLNGPMTRRKRILQPTITDGRRTGSSRRSTVQLEGSLTSTPTPEPETRQRRRRANPSVRATAAMGQDEGEEDGTDPEPRPAKRGRKSRKPKPTANLAVSEDLIGETKIVDQNESTSRRKPAAVNIHWSDKDKSLFLGLLSQHGDDFKRIAASMPNKTTIQVSNYYKSNLVDLNLEKVAAGAPKRSPTPEVTHDSWKETSHYPGSGIMTPLTGLTASSSFDSERLQSQGGTSPARRLQPRDLLSVVDQKTSSAAWLAPNSAGDAMATSGIRSSLSEHGEIVDASPRPSSPFQALPHIESKFPNGTGSVNKPSFLPTPADPFLLTRLAPHYTGSNPASLAVPEQKGYLPSKSRTKNPHASVPSLPVSRKPSASPMSPSDSQLTMMNFPILQSYCK